MALGEPRGDVKNPVMTKSIGKVKFKDFTLKTPRVLPVKDQVYSAPVKITNINVKNKNRNNSSKYKPVLLGTKVKNLRYQFIIRNNPKIEQEIRNYLSGSFNAITNIKSVKKYTKPYLISKHEKPYISGKKKYQRILFYGYRNEYVDFNTFIKAYPSAKFLIDYYHKTPPPIITDIISFIKKGEISETTKIHDLEGLFKIFLFKDICIFKILGEIKNTQYKEVIDFLKTKIKKYLADPNTIMDKIWNNLDFTELRNHPEFGPKIRHELIWTILEKSGVLTNTQLYNIADNYNKKYPDIFSNYKKKYLEGKKFQLFLRSNYASLPNNILKNIRNKVLMTQVSSIPKVLSIE